MSPSTVLEDKFIGAFIGLSLGDALSIALMKVKNFGKLDFKKFHPEGNLANKLKTNLNILKYNILSLLGSNK